MPSSIPLRARALSRRFATARGPVLALPPQDLEVRAGEAVALVGRSGCGKSTLLNVLGLLEQPTGGTLSLLGTDVLALGPHERARFRLAHVGFVFQNFCLLKDRSIRDNVALPLVYAGVPLARRRHRAEAWLERVGLRHLGDRRPAELSGGQQQRAAIARAMVPEPGIVLADEPTGSLDAVTGGSVFDDLLQFCRSGGAACVVVTHDQALARRCHRIEPIGAASESMPSLPEDARA